MTSTKNAIVALRLSRLGRIPSALFASELIQESGLPVVVVEFGNMKESKKVIQEKFTRIRMDAPWVAWLPKKWRSAVLLVTTFIKLCWLFLVSGRPQMIVAHGIIEETLGVLLSYLFFVPLVIHAHEVYDKNDIRGGGAGFLLAFQKQAFRKAAFTVFPEKTRARIYQERYDFKGPVFIAANTPRWVAPPQPRDLRKAYQLGPHTLLMGYVGGIGPSNLLELAIEALGQFPRLVLLVWGWGERSYLEQLTSLAHCLGVSERFHHLGILTENKLETLAGCDFSYCVYDPRLLRLKYGASASNKFFEAMAAGIPSIISSNPDFYQFNRQNPVGVCAKTLTTEGVSEAIRSLASDSALRKHLGANARKVFESGFHYEHQFFKPLQAFQDLYYGYPEIWSQEHVYYPPEDLPKAA